MTEGLWVGEPMVSYYRKVAASTGDEVIGFGVVPAGEYWVVERLVAYDDDGAATSLRVVLAGKESEYPVYLKTTVAADTWYTVDYPFIVTEGMELRVIFNGATAGDHLIVAVYAFKMGRGRG